MEKKKIIYLVQTEFQLMVAVNLSVSLYNTPEYTNKIYYRVTSNRLNEELDLSIDINGEFEAIEDKDYFKYVRKIAADKCYRFYFFQENSIFNKYIAYNLRKKGAIIALGPDGTKPYGLFSKNHEVLSMMKDTVNDYLKLRKAGLFLPTLIPSRYYRYGRSKIIDEVWLYNIDLFNAAKNKTKASLKQIPQFSDVVWERISKLFKFSPDLLPQREGVFFYINQPLWTDALVDAEITFLKRASEIYSGHQFIIKLHPLTPQKTIDRYNEIPNLSLIRSKIPAELFIASLSKSIVFSGWSAGLSIDNPKCSFYFLLNVFKKTKDVVLEQIEFTTFDHITLIDEPEQMAFKN